MFAMTDSNINVCYLAERPSHLTRFVQIKADTA